MRYKRTVLRTVDVRIYRCVSVALTSCRTSILPPRVAHCLWFGGRFVLSFSSSDSNITTIAVQFGTLKRSVRLFDSTFVFWWKMCCCVSFWCQTSPLSTLSAWIFDYPQYFQNIELVTFDSVWSRDTLERMLTRCWLSELQSSTDTTSTACNSDWNERDAKLNTNCCPLSIVCSVFFFCPIW